MHPFKAVIGLVLSVGMGAVADSPDPAVVETFRIELPAIAKAVGSFDQSNPPLLQIAVDLGAGGMFPVVWKGKKLVEPKITGEAYSCDDDGRVAKDAVALFTRQYSPDKLNQASAPYWSERNVSIDNNHADAPKEDFRGKGPFCVRLTLERADGRRVLGPFAKVKME